MTARLKPLQHHMQREPFRPSSNWFATLVALLVALGAQSLLDALAQAGAVHWLFPPSGPDAGPGYALGLEALIIRLASFAVGGLVGVLLTRRLSRGLLAMLIGAAVIAALLAQFPGRGSAGWLVGWFLSGPAGIAAGAWAAYVWRRAT